MFFTFPNGIGEWCFVFLGFSNIFLLGNKRKKKFFLFRGAAVRSPPLGRGFRCVIERGCPEPKRNEVKAGRSRRSNNKKKPVKPSKHCEENSINVAQKNKTKYSSDTKENQHRHRRRNENFDNGQLGRRRKEEVMKRGRDKVEKDFHPVHTNTHTHTHTQNE